MESIKRDSNSYSSGGVSSSIICAKDELAVCYRLWGLWYRGEQDGCECVPNKLETRLRVVVMHAFEDGDKNPYSFLVEPGDSTGYRLLYRNLKVASSDSHENRLYWYPLADLAIELYLNGTNDLNFRATSHRIWDICRSMTIEQLREFVRLVNLSARGYLEEVVTGER